MEWIAETIEHLYSFYQAIYDLGWNLIEIYLQSNKIIEIKCH